ncbi:MAG: DUF5320 domain-containing protein [Deltaproteobacteria bacterium]|nr:DUF5320 domain-containing protein [Deltaproteobacteria bacterium]
MPGGDGTGPAGWGPMTGRAAGYCAGYPMPGFANQIPGRGFGFGRGMGLGFRGGRGRRWGIPYFAYGYGMPSAVPYGAAPTRQQEIDALQEQAKYFEAALSEINKRIGDLEAEHS